MLNPHPLTTDRVEGLLESVLTVLGSEDASASEIISVAFTMAARAAIVATGPDQDLEDRLHNRRLIEQACVHLLSAMPAERAN